jgi:hypothetical protein
LRQPRALHSSPVLQFSSSPVLPFCPSPVLQFSRSFAPLCRLALADPPNGCRLFGEGGAPAMPSPLWGGCPKGAGGVFVAANSQLSVMWRPPKYPSRGTLPTFRHPGPRAGIQSRDVHRVGDSLPSDERVLSARRRGLAGCRIKPGMTEERMSPSNTGPSRGRVSRCDHARIHQFLTSPSNARFTTPRWRAKSRERLGLG